MIMVCGEPRGVPRALDPFCSQAYSELGSWKKETVLLRQSVLMGKQLSLLFILI